MGKVVVKPYKDTVTNKIMYHLIENLKEHYIVVVKNHPVAYGALPMIFHKSAYNLGAISAGELQGVLRRLDKIDLPSAVPVRSKDEDGQFPCFVTERKKK